MLDYLPVRAEERIRACGGFKKDKKKFQSYDNNLKLELGSVTYNGTGKYRETDVVAPWSAIPEDEGAFPQPGQQGILPHLWNTLLRGGPLFAFLTPQRER